MIRKGQSSKCSLTCSLNSFIKTFFLVLKAEDEGCVYIFYLAKVKAV